MIEIHAQFGQAPHYDLNMLGRAGEHGTRQIVFDCADALREYPNARIICAVLRPRDTTPYPAELTATGDTRILTLTRTETYLPGLLKLELRAVDGERVLKSALYVGRITESLQGDGDKPGNPLSDALNRLESTITNAQSLADEIRQKLDNGEFVGERGPQGEPGSDATVTAEAVQAALGYKPVQEVRAGGRSVTSNGIATVDKVDAAYYVEPRATNGGLDFSTLPFSPFSGGDPLAFLEPDRIIIESTTDGGQTWVDAGISNNLKRMLFMPGNQLNSVPLPLIDGTTTLDCGLRVTISSAKFNVPDGTSETDKINHWTMANMDVNASYRYAVVQGLYFWVSGRDQPIRMTCKCAMDGATGFDSNSEIVCASSLWGWAGANFVPTDTMFGGFPHTVANNKKYVWRFEFFPSASTNGPVVIYNISGISSSDWSSDDSYVKRRKLYEFDIGRNVTFPANLTVKGELITKQPTFELIEEIESDGNEVIERTVEPNGRAYSFSQVLCVVTAPKNIDAVANIYVATSSSNYTVSTYTSFPSSSPYFRRAQYNARIANGLLTLTATDAMISYGDSLYNGSTDAGQVTMSPTVYLVSAPISKVRMYNTAQTNIPAGFLFQIYGVRA